MDKTVPSGRGDTTRDMAEEEVGEVIKRTAENKPSTEDENLMTKDKIRLLDDEENDDLFLYQKEDIQEFLLNKQSVSIPHLDDPEKQDDILDTQTKEIPDFAVRLGTCLARTNAESQAKALLKKLQMKTATMHLPSVTSISPDMRRDSRRTSLVREKSFRTMSRVLGRVSRQRRRISLASITSDTPDTRRSLESVEQPYLKFQRVARMVRLIARIWLALKSYVKQPDRTEWSFMEMYLDVRDDLHQKVAFNPHSYVKVEPTRDRLKRLLSTVKSQRTIDDVRMILSLLRDNSSFKDYPAHTQIQLATCMEYLCYEPRRVILRQGHIPSGFYILLSGSTIVNIKDKDPRTNKTFFRTVHEMTAGDTFGEIALLESGKRTATVICKTPCELLVVHKEDFDEIIKNPLMREKVKHINFCQSLPVFKDFPCHVFSRHPNDFFYQYFRKGEVIVKDCRASKYIIVVAAGHCQIISDVKETLKDRLHGPMFDRNIEEAFPLYTQMRKIKAMAPRQRTDGTQEDPSDIRVKLLTGTFDKEALTEKVMGKPASLLERRMSRKLLIQRCNTVTNLYDRLRNSQNDQESIEAVGKENVLNSAKQTGYRHSAGVKRSVQIPPPRQLKSAAAKTNRSSQHLDSVALEMLEETRTLHAQISELKTGAIFGLEALLSRPSTTLSLVSDGAECILISKKLFLQEANIKVIRIVTDLVHNHPCHDYIKEQIYTHRKWSKYKRDLVEDIVNRHNRMEPAFVGGTPDKKYPVPAEAY